MSNEARQCHSGDLPLTNLTVTDLRTLILEQLKGAMGPLDKSVTHIVERLSAAVPFADTSLFGQRYRHFFDEKRAIAEAFMEDLDRLVDDSHRTQRRIRLVLDSGTTVFPIFRMLMARKNETKWTDRIEIITNNIPGVFVTLEEGRRTQEDSYSGLAYRVRVVGGEPAPAFWALLPPYDSEKGTTAPEVTRIMAGADGCGLPSTVVAVTTGSYVHADGRALFVRNRQHYGFKQAMIKCANVIYCLCPLGKMVPRTAREMNEALVTEDLRRDPDHLYSELQTKVNGEQKYIVVTTQRQPPACLYTHFKRVKEQLTALDSNRPDSLYVGTRVVYVPTEKFWVSTLTGGNETKEVELEIPHKAHRDVLMKWFRWNEHPDG